MRRALVAANWKMNGSVAQANELLSAFRDRIKGDHMDAVVFPPAPYLPLTEQLLSGSQLAWGGQNCHYEAQGAFTGEISLSMLKDFGCQFVLIGHSERRSLFGETDELVAKKVQAALDQGVTPMICVGETLEQREKGDTEKVIAAQIQSVLDQVGVSGLGNAVIAYEPVWAIGTGKTASPEQAQQVHEFIRGLVAQQDERVAENLHILYGGSVKADNAEQLFSMKDIDGGLIGGASLKADDFVAICMAAE